MRTRHRIPTIFNLSMVDVLCCALGCVILLWLLNLREAKHRAVLAGTTNERLTATQQELKTAQDEITALRSKAAGLLAQLDESTRRATLLDSRILSAEEEARATAARLERSRDDNEKAKARLANLDRDLVRLRTEKSTTEEHLVRKGQEYRDLDKKLLAANQRVASLETQVREQESMAGTSGKRADDLAARLAKEEARAKDLQAMADQVPSLRDDVKSYRDKFSNEEALAKGLEKEIGKRNQELTDASHALALLQTDKKTLTAEVGRVRALVENRFAGIALTGRRVVFLIDMSGSMELVDESTPAPDKWRGVRETVAKIMRSLPDLEKFQVIVFSDKASYLLGQEGRWFDYDPKTSVDRVVTALTDIKPKGGTDMYVPLQETFRLRGAGLDTIYLLSDGLPNMGEGLTPQMDNLKETEKGEILGKVIRRALKTAWNRDIAGRSRVRINTVGFFFESPDVGAFLWALARENDGSFVGMSKP